MDNYAGARPPRATSNGPLPGPPHANTNTNNPMNPHPNKSGNPNMNRNSNSNTNTNNNNNNNTNMNMNMNNNRNGPMNQYTSSKKAFAPVPYSADEQKRILMMLNKVLGPEYVSFRPGGGGQKVSYIEGWKALNLANEVFGFNGWCSELISSQVDFFDTHGGNGRFLMGLSVVVRITIKDGTYHEDFGYGFIENAKSKAMAFEKCKKEAFTDGLKRCLRCFGNVLGNCLYDRTIIPKLNKIKVQGAELESRHFHRDPMVTERINQKKVSNIMPEAAAVPSIPSPAAPSIPSPPVTSVTSIPAATAASGSAPSIPAATSGSVPAAAASTTSVTPSAETFRRPNSLGKPKSKPDPKDNDVVADFDDSFVFSDDVLDDLANDGLDYYEMEMLMQKNLDKIDTGDELDISSDTLVSDKQTSRSTEATTEAATASEPADMSTDLIPENVTFVSAKSADIIQKNPDDPNKVAQFDPKFLSPNIRRTVDPTKSTPIKRTTVSGTKSNRISKPVTRSGHLQPSQISNTTAGLGKRMLGLPPSQRSQRHISQDTMENET